MAVRTHSTVGTILFQLTRQVGQGLILPDRPSLVLTSPIQLLINPARIIIMTSLNGSPSDFSVLIGEKTYLIFVHTGCDIIHYNSWSVAIKINTVSYSIISLISLLFDYTFTGAASK